MLQRRDRSIRQAVCFHRAWSLISALLVAITDAVRVLKPGGRLVIADVREPRSCGECLHELGIRYLVTPAQLALLVQWSVGGPLLTAEKLAGDA